MCIHIVFLFFFLLPNNEIKQKQGGYVVFLPGLKMCVLKEHNFLKTTPKEEDAKHKCIAHFSQKLKLLLDEEKKKKKKRFRRKKKKKNKENFKNVKK